jgi:ribosomal protein S18 acetylase RimI-like enzyme
LAAQITALCADDPERASDRTEMVSLNTQAGLLTIARARAADYDSVMAILREAADWISACGNPPWNHWYMDAGERILRDRIAHHEVFLARRDGIPVGTVTIQWNDAETWGERGLDGSAGYIHAIAIARSVGGMRVGERLLEWAVETIEGRGRHFVRLDTIAANAVLCSYYEQRGFRSLGTATLFGGMYTARLFERELRLK